MTQLSSKVTRFDVSFILEHYRNPALWGKVWTIFEYGSYKVEVRLYTIMTYDKSINIEITFRNTKNTYEYNRTYVYFYLNNLNKEANKNKLDGELLRLMERHEANYLITETSAYKLAREAERAHTRMVENLANERLDELGIEDDDIRKAYITAQKSNNQKDYTSEVVDSLEFTMIPDLYLSYALFADNEKKYNYYLKEIELNQDKEELDELVSAIKEELGKIEIGEIDDTVELGDL